eukprot:CAMPEP_0174839486 /NCGR_PEP_ID=MMETSP1114-20130205/8073_1 /TAXON_ID=312471 /ORGANISM="Neobodo designis, Strain CCAP 1951/1" /LENGTH=42 /DNA_ID= /DNA_START= /DNA_END= /DNA_ORIENTATION=
MRHTTRSAGWDFAPTAIASGREADAVGSAALPRSGRFVVGRA